MDKRVAEAILKTVKAKGSLTVEELIKEAAEGINVSEHVVARHLYWLWREEAKLKLEDPNPPLNLWQYAKSLHSLWFWILFAVVATASLAIYVLPQTPPFIYLRYALGSIFVLYLPGFALIESLFPRKEDLDPLERLALSIGLSLAVVPLVGLALNYTPWGIKLDPVFSSLAILTVALSAMAVKRKFACFKTEIERAEK